MSSHRSFSIPRAAHTIALGLALAVLTALSPGAAAAQGLGVTLQPSDLVIVAVDAGSPGDRAGLRAGDQLQALDGKPVRTVAQVQEIIASMRGPTSVIVQRGTRRLQGSITLARDAAGGQAAQTAAAPRTAGGATAGGATARGAAAGVATGRYQCVMFVTNQLINSGELTITGPGTYRGGGADGTYTYDAGTGLVRFRGGSFNGQKADYETSGGRSVLQMYGPSGRRGVLTCGGPSR
ncbi:MAG: PDZ domain-containing protein [Gemmatirosa sp.]